MFMVTSEPDSTIALGEFLTFCVVAASLGRHFLDLRSRGLTASAPLPMPGCASLPGSLFAKVRVIHIKMTIVTLSLSISFCLSVSFFSSLSDCSVCRSYRFIYVPVFYCRIHSLFFIYSMFSFALNTSLVSFFVLMYMNNYSLTVLFAAYIYWYIRMYIENTCYFIINSEYG